MTAFDVANAATEFAKGKVNQLFNGKGYSENELGVIQSALEVGYIAGAMAVKNAMNDRIDSLISGRT